MSTFLDAEILSWFLIGMLWTGIGLMLLFVIFSVSTTNPLYKAKGLEFLNPVWLWKNYRLNPFGAALIALVFSMACPLLAVGYWIYKLCTFGKKTESVEATSETLNENLDR